MTNKVIASLLKEITGVDSAARGTSLLKSAVSARMKHTAVGNMDAYAKLVIDSGKELQALIDELMVTETWFFRDSEPFYYLLEYAQKEWLACTMNRPLRVLSVPCATGEEPYSIAMTLLQSGLDRNQFTVDAVDISLRAIRYAKRAVYGKHSFRGDTHLIQEQFLTKKKNGMSVQKVVCNAVSFKHKNFWDATLSEQSYDIIFCRNLLIYFDKQTQSEAVQKLYQMMAPGGLLFVGHADGMCISKQQFNSIRRSGAFAYQKILPTTDSIESESVYDAEVAADNDGIDASGFRATEKEENQPAVINANHPGSNVTMSHDQTRRYELEQVQQYLDDGNVAEAALICKQHIQRYPNSGHGYYLLGRCIELGGDQTAAVTMYRRAIGLESEHYQALVRLVALLEQTGDVVAATIFRDRVQRILFADRSKKAAPHA